MSTPSRSANCPASVSLQAVTPLKVVPSAASHSELAQQRPLSALRRQPQLSLFSPFQHALTQDLDASKTCLDLQLSFSTNILV